MVSDRQHDEEASRSSAVCPSVHSHRFRDLSGRYEMAFGDRGVESGRRCRAGVVPVPHRHVGAVERTVSHHDRFGRTEGERRAETYPRRTRKIMMMHAPITKWHDTVAE